AELAGRPEVPIHAGRAEPLMRPLETAQFVHGEDGMAGAVLPEPSRAVDRGEAVEALLAIAADEPDAHTLVTLGPLTNIALCLEQAPTFLEGFQHVYLMAGSPDGVGNVNALGEFNVWADPEAASSVLAAPGTKTIIGWNISRQYAVMRPEESARLADCGRLGRFCVAINRVVEQYCRDTGLEGMDLPDPVAMAVALDDSIITDSTDEALVVGIDEPTRGAVLPDRRFLGATANTRVVWAVDEPAFKERLYAACSD
ncbi:MAG: nucleoside hydrolase, partial [Acidimicrobiales bacterium]